MLCRSLDKVDTKGRNLGQVRHQIRPKSQMMLNPARVLCHAVLCCAGLGAGEAETLEKLDPKWQVNGKFGVVQFAESA